MTECSREGVVETLIDAQMGHSHGHKPGRSDRSTVRVPSSLHGPRLQGLNISNHDDEGEPRMVATDATNTRDKQSLHYIVRSGLAGGIAGCVVSHLFGSSDLGLGEVVTIWFTGEDGRCAAR